MTKQIPDYVLLARDLRRELVNFFKGSNMDKVRCQRLADKHKYQMLIPEPNSDDYCDYIFLKILKTEKQVIRANLIADSNTIIREIQIKLRKEKNL